MRNIGITFIDRLLCYAFLILILTFSMRCHLALIPLLFLHLNSIRTLNCLFYLLHLDFELVLKFLFNKDFHFFMYVRFELVHH